MLLGEIVTDIAEIRVRIGLMFAHEVHDPGTWTAEGRITPSAARVGGQPAIDPPKAPLVWMVSGQDRSPLLLYSKITKFLCHWFLQLRRADETGSLI